MRTWLVAVACSLPLPVAGSLLLVIGISEPEGMKGKTE